MPTSPATELTRRALTYLADPEDVFDIHRIERPLRTAPSTTGRPSRTSSGWSPSTSTVTCQRRADPGRSSDRAVFDTLLGVYAVLAELVVSGRLLDEDRVRHVEGHFHGLFSFLASGPPPRRLAELLALHRAGIVRFLGPDLELAVRTTPSSGGSGDREMRARAAVDATAAPARQLPRHRRRSWPACSPRASCVPAPSTAVDGTALGAGQLVADARARASPRRRLRAPTALPPRARGLGVRRRRRASRGPGFNGPGFRQNDAVARDLLTVPSGPRRGDPQRTPAATHRIRHARTSLIHPRARPHHRPARTTHRPNTDEKGPPSCQLSSWESPPTTTARRPPPAAAAALDLRVRHEARPRPRGQRLGPHPLRLPLGLARPGTGRRPHRGQHRAAQPRRRAPAQHGLPHPDGQDLRHPRPHQRRPLRGARHHRRQHRRPGRRGRPPRQGRPLRPHPGVHPDPQAGVDERRAVRLRRRALPVRGLPGRHQAAPAPAPADLLRRVEPAAYAVGASGGRRLRASGASRSPAPREQIETIRTQPRRPAARSRPSRSPSGRSSARRTSWPGTRPSAPSAPSGARSRREAPLRGRLRRNGSQPENAGSQRLLAAAEHGGAPRPGPVDRDGRRHRRRRQLHGPRRHARDRRGGRSSTTTTSACASSRPAATTSTTTPSTSAATSSRSCATRSHVERRTPTARVARRPSHDGATGLGAWRATRGRSSREEHGWLSLTGFAWLSAGPSAVPGCPGCWWADDDGAHAPGAADG